MQIDTPTQGVPKLSTCFAISCASVTSGGRLLKRSAKSWCSASRVRCCQAKQITPPTERNRYRNAKKIVRCGAWWSWLGRDSMFGPQSRRHVSSTNSSAQAYGSPSWSFRSSYCSTAVNMCCTAHFGSVQFSGLAAVAVVISLLQRGLHHLPVQHRPAVELHGVVGHAQEAEGQQGVHELPHTLGVVHALPAAI